jgi:hypothetical protein
LSAVGVVILAGIVILYLRDKKRQELNDELAEQTSQQAS